MDTTLRYHLIRFRKGKIIDNTQLNYVQFADWESKKVMIDDDALKGKFHSIAMLRENRTI